MKACVGWGQIPTLDDPNIRARKHVASKKIVKPPGPRAHEPVPNGLPALAAVSAGR